MSNSKKIVPSDAPSSAPARRQRRISDREVIQEEEESQDTDTSSHKTRKKQSAKDMNATQVR
ncbi:hypothetical protein V5O48_005813 [Marasmius crinis-equi]|uniref:Uncharacterized protein n=1 Tax=Marasmius crinis-equi TaxID=585013 RepID=A0ABR3FLG5_9AGAR